MPRRTFEGCSKLNVSLPAGLFSGNANRAFYRTFQNDTGLTTLPDGLFETVDYSADMFNETFDGCTNLESTPFSLN